MVGYRQYLWTGIMVVGVVFGLSACTQESQNQLGRSIQNWTGTNGVVEVYSGGQVVKRFIHVDKLSTAYGTNDGNARPYRFGYGIIDENMNLQKDPGEKKVYFELCEYTAEYIFFENPKD